jgi:sugar phosphate isomerase/epimerase
MLPCLLTDSVTLDLDRAVHYTLLWGLEGVDLRTVGGPSSRVPFVNEARLGRRLMEADLPLAAVDPGMFEGDVADRSDWLNELASFDETLSFCRRLGCTRILVSAFREGGDPDSVAGVLRRAGHRAREAGIQICVMNQTGTVARNGEDLARIVDAAGGSSVVAAWDPAEAAAAGEDPKAGVEALKGRIGLVRCCNGVETGNGWEARSIDTGSIDWLDQIRRLARARFSGPISLVVVGEQRARRGLHEATALIGWIRAAQREAGATSPGNM